MFIWLYNLLGSMLAWFESWTGTYALALLFYALIFKILFLPFSIKQQKNQIAMAKLAPKIELIKAKYKGRTDRPTMEKQQMEIMELQRKEGYSPFSGCLPLLIQLPLIMLLYSVIQHPLSYIADYNMDAPKIEQSEELSENDKIENAITNIYNHINELEGENKKTYKDIENSQINLISQINGYITVDGKVDEAKKAEIEEFGLDVDSMPDFMLFGVNLADTPSISKISILVIIPILAAIASWFSMWITRKVNGNSAMNASQDAQAQASMKMMDIVMPLMTLFLAFSFSGMLGLYWIFQSILGIGQTLVLAKVMPLPKYTEEELKAMRKAQKAAEKAQRAAIKEQPKYKSLHYIDEDDYEELPEVKTNQNSQSGKKLSGTDVPEIKD